MPTREIHLKASKVYLGYCHPVVHDILDRYLPAAEHRRAHHPAVMKHIGRLLGKEAEIEAWLHFFMDYGIVKGKWLKKEVKDGKKLNFSES